jgi:hypothetical protein
MRSSFQPDDLMVILDGIDDAVVKLDGQARFAGMNQAAVDIYQRTVLASAVETVGSLAYTFRLHGNPRLTVHRVSWR